MDQNAKEISKSSGSSFYYAFNLLPEEQRDAMNTVYAFCRRTDDIVDNIDKNIIEGINNYMDRHKIMSVSELTGGLQM